jgi:hypothetical protein
VPGSKGEVRTRVRTARDFRVRDLDGLALHDAGEHRLELGPKLAYVVAVLNDLGRLAAQERGLTFSGLGKPRAFGIRSPRMSEAQKNAGSASSVDD